MDLSGSSGGTLTNVTVTGNRSDDPEGALEFSASGALTIVNSIFWNNQDSAGTGTLSSAITDLGGGSIVVSSSLLQGSGGSVAWNAGAIADGGNNLDEDPLFVVPVDPATAPATSGDLHLLAGSLAVNAGDNSVITTSEDLDGEDRIQDSIVDLGVYEGADPYTDISVTLSDGVTVATPGQSLTYTIVVSNLGPADVSPGWLIDEFPAELSCSWTTTASGGASGNNGGSGLLGDMLVLPVGSSVTYTVACDIAPAATGTISNTVAISSDLLDVDLDNNSATDADTVLVPSADLAITMGDGVTSAVPGQALTYTIVASNTGPSSATSVSVTDVFPEDLTCSWTSVPSGGTTGNTNASGDVAETLSMPVTSSVTYTAICDIDPAATGILSNAATINWAGNDPNSSNNTATDVDTELVPSADLAITMDDGVTSAVPGQSLTYTIAASNTGPSSAPSVSVTDTFPSGLTCSWTSVPSGGATGNTNASGDFAETLNLPKASSVTYTAICDIDPAATGVLSNTASIDWVGSDPNSSNNSASDDDTVLSGEADLGITVSDSVDPVTPSDDLTYTVVVENNGPSDAASVVVNHSLPAGVSFLSTSGCVEDPDGDTECSAGTIAAGAMAEYTVEVNVDDAFSSGTIIFGLSVSSMAIDPNSSNDSIQEETRVIADPPSVVFVDSVLSNGPSGLFHGTIAEGPLTQLIVTFSEAMQAVEAHNLDNFTLVRDGGDGIIETVVCGSLNGDDQAVALADASYDSGESTTRLTIEGTAALPAGAYRLLASPALVNESGAPLDGDGNGVGGDTFSRDFFVNLSDLLDNPNLDSSLSSWSLTSASPTEILFAPIDVDDAVSSGAIWITNESGDSASFSVSQCVSISSSKFFTLAGFASIDSPLDVTELQVSVESFDQTDCAGILVDTDAETVLAGDSELAWLPIRSGPLEVAMNAESVRIVYSIRAAGDTNCVAYLDALFASQARIFLEGFESGGTMRWSGSVP